MISVILHTASEDNFLKAQGTPSYFAALVKNLSRQTTNNFELIYVDAHHTQNEQHHRSIVTPFPTKHVPIHPAHRYWFDRGNCFIAAAKNTGILHASGELIVSFDDAEFFPVDLLAKYREHYRNGKHLLALHKRRRTTGAEYVTDHRWKGLSKTRTVEPGWAFAGTSFTRNDALLINGYNERMDGYKALEDCEFAVRLAKLPGGRTFVIDPTAWLWITDHPPYNNITQFQAVENHGMLRCAEELPGYRANDPGLSAAQLKIIIRETIRFRKYDPTTPDRAERFKIWRNTPTFDLARQWRDLHL